MQSALAAHSRVDLKMHSHRSGAEPSRLGSFFQLPEMPLFPDNGSQAIGKESRSLAGENSADDENASFGFRGCATQALAGGHTLFRAGDAQPADAGAHRGRHAQLQRMSICVGFHHGQQLSVRSGQSFEQAIVFFQRLGVDLHPAGACCHWAFQALVYGSRLLLAQHHGRPLRWPA